MGTAGRAQWVWGRYSATGVNGGLCAPGGSSEQSCKKNIGKCYKINLGRGVNDAFSRHIYRVVKEKSKKNQSKKLIFLKEKFWKLRRFEDPSQAILENAWTSGFIFPYKLRLYYDKLLSWCGGDGWRSQDLCQKRVIVLISEWYWMQIAKA